VRVQSRFGWAAFAGHPLRVSLNQTATRTKTVDNLMAVDTTIQRITDFKAQREETYSYWRGCTPG